MDADAQERFRRFVDARAGALFRTAYALTGHQQAAEDLLQTALARTVARWRWVQRQDDPEGYVRRVMYHQQVSVWRRLRRLRETTTADLPERAEAPAGDTDLRLSLQAALRRLPARQRAVVVLRHLDDLSETEVAATMGTTVGTVRSQNAKALARLRVLCPGLAASGHDVAPDRGPASAPAVDPVVVQ